MRKIKNRNQLTFDGMPAWKGSLSERKVKLLKKTWAGVFQTYILPNLPVAKLALNYSPTMGRPSKELFTVMGGVILQQFFDLTDERTIEELAFNQQWHYALDNYDVNDQVISERTLWNVRNLLTGTEAGLSIFNITVDHLIKHFDVDTSRQRLDSVHVHSNMARLGRVRILSRVITRFLRNFKRHHYELYEDLDKRFRVRYLDEKDIRYFGEVRPSETGVRLQEIAEDLYELILLFSDNEAVIGLYSYGLMKRVFGEHCQVDSDKQVKVTANKDVPSDSLQNPSDVDASYDGHKGQGYQVQVMETHAEKAGQKGDDPRLDLFTHVAVEPAHTHDSGAVKAALEDVSERGNRPEELVADTLYGSQDNVELARADGTELVAPVYGKKSKKDFPGFEFNQDYDIITCPAGNSPSRIKSNKHKGSKTALWEKDVCSECPLQSLCRVRKGKSFYLLSYTEKVVKLWLRREYEQTKAFKNKYGMRAGVEASISRIIHQTGARRLRYRGLECMRFAETMKVLAVNMFRTTKYVLSSAQMLPQSA
ncbi:MAG: transposase [Candidatus Marinimicrobia bacterium]|nr:transposase [Candidatus Neomarinimicrobiota bacterium]